MPDKLEAVNAVLAEFTHETWVERGANGWIVNWKRGDRVISRRWQTKRGSDHYPVWHRKWAHGGTSCTALSQLVRWLQNRPVLPIGTWKYWTGPTVKLGTPNIVSILTEAGYPQISTCVACDQPLSDTLDWYHRGKISGPCHSLEQCPK